MVYPPLRLAAVDLALPAFGLWIYSIRRPRSTTKGGNTINGDYDCVDAGQMR